MKTYGYLSNDYEMENIELWRKVVREIVRTAVMADKSLSKTLKKKTIGGNNMFSDKNLL